MFRLSLVAFAGALMLASCGGSDEYSPAEKVRSALEDRVSDIKYREVDVPDGAEEVVAGRATDEHGISVDFAITFVDGNHRPSGQFPAVEAPGGGSQGFYDVGSVAFYFNSNGYSHYWPEDSKAEAKARQDLKFAVEGAACRSLAELEECFP